MMTAVRCFRFRSISWKQIALILFISFVVGYCFLPVLLRQENEKVTMELVRDRGIRFTSSGKEFVVEGKKKRILSGAVHYFRIPPPYWMDRLTKLKAAGLNTVETYMPWNLHEPVPGKFNFTGILDVYRFLTMAQSLHLHVIVRPGPYICSEWEMGGLPAWLLHDPDMIVRSSYQPYLTAVQEYFTKVIRILEPLQSSYGGPIIALQIENEYAMYGDMNSNDSQNYMKFLYQLLRRLGVVELLFTSDGQNSMEEAKKLRPADDVLLTVNFMSSKNALEKLAHTQPGKPVMVMEFWSGWFDSWKDSRLTRNQSPDELASKTAAILKFGASLNYYMFHGGTNFGFMNGANWDTTVKYKPLVTSYDYDAPLSENGDVTAKFAAIRRTLSSIVPDSVSEFPLPPVPPNIPTTSYGELKLTLYLPIIDGLKYLPEPFASTNTIAMEMLPLHGCGQSYGFVLYRALISSQAETITVLQLSDYGVALIDSVPVQDMSYASTLNFHISPSISKQNKDKAMVTLDILVENAGRVNFGHPLESRKGILGGILVDGIKLTGWKIYSLEFLPQFIADINAGEEWQLTPLSMISPGPALFKGSFTIDDAPKDTFMDMKGWEKGVVFVNGANLGRYWNVGPQRTLYIPAPVLKRGVNQVMVFEIYSPKKPQTIFFRDKPILDSTRTPL